MELIFSNQRGSIKMDGGSGDALYKIKSVEGLGYMNQNATTAEYPFLCGQKTLLRSPAPRIITVSFDSFEEGKRNEGFLGKVAHDPGRLFIGGGEKRVYADCCVSALSKTMSWGKEYERYVIQFTCDYPYFKDSRLKTETLFKRERLLRGSFALPKVFSARTVGSSIFLGGDKEVYPVIEISGIEQSEDFDLVFKNETTGARLRVLLPAGEYRKIVFDLKNGAICCGEEDFTVYLDDDSFMSDFYLQKGENRLSITAGGIAVDTAAAVSFEEEYISATED